MAMEPIKTLYHFTELAVQPWAMSAFAALQGETWTRPNQGAPNQPLDSEAVCQ